MRYNVMYISIFDIFKIGIGPSSSHTFGPMRVGYDFVSNLQLNNKLKNVDSIAIELYGSLALTKEGHGTGIAIKLGLEGYKPETFKSEKLVDIMEKIKNNGKINLFQKQKIDFSENDFILFKNKELPHHPNGMILKAFNKNNELIHSEEYYSIGGGFIETKASIINQNKKKTTKQVRHNFTSWTELEKLCEEQNKEVWEIILENEKSFLTESQINRKIAMIFKIMMDGIKHSIKSDAKTINGGLNLKRRSKEIYTNLKKSENTKSNIIEWINLWGIAASEENASYGRVITAPTNGACGVIPAVLKYYKEFFENSNFNGVKKFILTAGAIGYLCKLNASISGAECGCQAEIGSACSMAAAGLVAALGGNYLQIENAAIIGLTHNLGLTCDPIGGLVQIPCIERNGINAVKAISSAKIALLEKESAYLTLDDVIFTMKETGDDMNIKYRETALGGLAKYAKECNKNCCDKYYKKIMCS